MSDSIATPEEVAKAIRADLACRNVKLVEAAERLGMSRQSVSQLLRGKSRFRVKTANLLRANFGYSLDYLLRGEGSLYKDAYGDATDRVYATGIKGDAIVYTNPSGNYYDNEDGLTKRQALLNHYAKILVPIFEMVLGSLPDTQINLSKLRINTDDFIAKDDKEEFIYRFIVYAETIIRQAMQPSLILEELEKLKD